MFVVIVLKKFELTIKWIYCLLKVYMENKGFVTTQI